MESQSSPRGAQAHPLMHARTPHTCTTREALPPNQHHGSASDFRKPLLRVRVHRASATQHAVDQPPSPGASSSPSTGRSTHVPSRRSSDSPMWKAVRAAANAARHLQGDSCTLSRTTASGRANKKDSSAHSTHNAIKGTQQLLHSKLPASRFPRMSRVMSWSLLGQAQATAESRPQRSSTRGSVSEGQLLQGSSWACSRREDGKASRDSKSSSGCGSELKPRDWAAASEAHVFAQQQQQQQQQQHESAASRAGEPLSQAGQAAFRTPENHPTSACPPLPTQPSAPCPRADQVQASAASCPLHVHPSTASDTQDPTHMLPRTASQHHLQPPPLGPPPTTRKCLHSFGFQFSLDGHSRGLHHAQQSATKSHRGASTAEYVAVHEASFPLPHANSSSSTISTPCFSALSMPVALCSSLSASQVGGGQQQHHLQQQQSWEHKIQDLFQPSLSGTMGARRGSCSAIGASMASSATAAAKVAVGGASCGSRRSVEVSACAPRCGSRRSTDVPVHKNGELMRLGPMTSALLLRSQ